MQNVLYYIALSVTTKASLNESRQGSLLQVDPRSSPGRAGVGTRKRSRWLYTVTQSASRAITCHPNSWTSIPAVNCHCIAKLPDLRHADRPSVGPPLRITRACADLRSASYIHMIKKSVVSSWGQHSRRCQGGNGSKFGQHYQLVPLFLQPIWVSAKRSSDSSVG